MFSIRSCHHYGAPLEACLSLTPQHELVKPEDGSKGPYKIEAESRDGKVYIKLYGKEFKGKNCSFQADINYCCQFLSVQHKFHLCYDQLHKTLFEFVHIILFWKDCNILSF